MTELEKENKKLKKEIQQLKGRIENLELALLDKPKISYKGFNLYYLDRQELVSDDFGQRLYATHENRIAACEISQDLQMDISWLEQCLSNFKNKLGRVEWHKMTNPLDPVGLKLASAERNNLDIPKPMNHKLDEKRQKIFQTN